LYTFGKIGHRREAALKTVSVQRATTEHTRETVIRKVKELYCALLLAQHGKDAMADLANAIVSVISSKKRMTVLPL
jgi:outer membrane protein TolC